MRPKPMDGRQRLPLGFQGNWKTPGEYYPQRDQGKRVLQELVHPNRGHKCRKGLDDDDDC